MSDEYRVKVVEVSLSFLVEMFKARPRAFEVIGDAVPDDALIVGASFPEPEERRDRVMIYIRSESFDPVPEGARCPRLVPVARTIDLPAEGADTLG